MTIRQVYPTLPNAPIEEVIISLTIGRQKHASSEELEVLYEKLKESYPQRNTWKTKEYVIEESSSGTNMSQHEKDTGFMISSDDRKKFLHLNKEMLSLNCLKPYRSWDVFSSIYKSAWEIYTENLQVKEISNITIRYINSFSISSEVNFYEYLLMGPIYGSTSKFDDSTISLDNFFARYVLSSERYMAQAVVLLNLELNDDGSLKVIMDIEVTSRTPIADYSGYHDITDVLNRLRDFKNQIFFANLPKAEEMFS